MAENTKIEWAHHTFNPWIGCTRVGPGCDHCYAADLAKARLGVEWGPGAERRRTRPTTWKQPRRWNNRAAKLGIRYRVFCASLADVFDNEVDPAIRADLFTLILDTPNLDWLLVTKRIGNVEKMMTEVGFVPGNVWLGITVVNQVEADRDIPKLAQAKRRLGIDIGFLSVEPMLGAIDLDRDGLLYQPCPNSIDLPPFMDPETGAYECCSRCDFSGISDELAVNWVIVGGESGAAARPMHPDWARTLRDQCTAARVAFLFKQWGEWSPIPEWQPGDRTPQIAVRFDGSAMPNESWFDDGARLKRVGKKAAGRLLDSAQHDGVPA